MRGFFPEGAAPRKPSLPPHLRRVAITGASSGIGAALALATAAPGMVLHLAGRDEARLTAVAEAARARGAAVRTALFDVRDAAAAAAWVERMEGLDLLLANAGVSGGTGGDSEPAAQARQIFATNLFGVLNTALPALERMAAQPPDAQGVRGRIAVVSSLAAFLAAPAAPAYCASKAAVRAWALAMDGAESPRGVRFHAVCPGHVRTPMTAGNRFPMPFRLEAEHAAAIILRGLAAGRTEIVFPWPTAWAARAVGALPAGWRNALFRRLPAKDRC